MAGAMWCLSRAGAASATPLILSRGSGWHQQEEAVGLPTPRHACCALGEGSSRCGAAKKLCTDAHMACGLCMTAATPMRPTESATAAGGATPAATNARASRGGRGRKERQNCRPAALPLLLTLLLLR